jgi:hypothetical protein
LTQVELAQITGIAPDYIRSLENSRRSLNNTQLEKIRFSIGAVWDPARKRWHPDGLPEEPFSYEWFSDYRRVWFEHPRQADIEVHVLCRRLQALLMGVEREDWNLVFNRLWSALEEVRTNLKIAGARSVFEKTAFTLSRGRDSKTKKINLVHRSFKNLDGEIIEPVPSANPPKLLDLTNWSAEKTWDYWGEGKAYIRKESTEEGGPDA